MAVSGSGFLSQVAADVRLWLDDPDADVKFTDANVVRRIRRAWADVIADLNRYNLWKPRARFDITVVADRRWYVLPTNIAQFEQWAKRDDDGNLNWEVIPRHPLHVSGPGFTIENRMLRLDPSWSEGETLTLTYVPNAESSMFEWSGGSQTGGVATGGTDTTAFSNDSGSLVAGSVDVRPNAYLGYQFHIISAGNTAEQTRTIVSQAVNDSTGVLALTLVPELSPTPTGTIVWEVIPQDAYRLQDLISLKVARFLAHITGDPQRASGIQAEYQDAMRSFRLDVAGADKRIGRKFNRRIRRRARLGKTR